MDFNITEMVQYLVSTVESWLPTVTSVASALICCIWGVARIKKAANDLRSDKTIAELRAEIENDLAANKEAQRTNRIILNKLLKVYDKELSDEGGEGRAEPK